MPTTIFSLPRGLRDKIYEYVWADLRSVTLHDKSPYGPWSEHYWPEEHIRFPETPSKRYPPPNSPSSKASEPAENTEEDWVDIDDEDETEKPKSKTAKQPIRFDVEAFLDKYQDAFDDEEEEGYDDEDEYDSEEDEDADESDGKNDHLRPRYNLRSWPAVNLSLLQVNRQLHAEALPVFYSTANFVLNADSVQAIRFFTKLPKVAVNAITTLTINGHGLMGDDIYCRESWSGSAEKPKYRDSSSLTLITPFASFLATTLPKLKHVFFYLPYAGDEDWYCSYAPLDLSMMLKYKRIDRLSFVFMGEGVAKCLKNKNHNSQDCYSAMMASWADCEKVAKHEFVLEHGEFPSGPFTEKLRKKGLKWMEEQDEYVGKNMMEFEWEWADRNIDMGEDGNVQAVVSCRLKKWI